MEELKSKHIKPKNCSECAHFGIISEITVFPSLCKRNYMWFQCGGKFGYKKISGMKKCPRCGKEYDGFPATSRKDNKTKICPSCGTEEALEAFQNFLIS